MPAPNHDLHGSAPDTHPVALLLVDVINPLEFLEADQLLRYTPALADTLANLKRRAKAAGVPVIYANDNFGRWRSDLSAVVARCQEAGCNGRELAERLQPEPDEYFVLKPKHSAFFATTLETLLQYLGTETLVIGGVAGDICVLFTANDAYLRDYRLVVPADAVASNTAEGNAAAVGQMARVLKADTRPAAEVGFEPVRWSARPLR